MKVMFREVTKASPNLKGIFCIDLFESILSMDPPRAKIMKVNGFRINGGNYRVQSSWSKGLEGQYLCQIRQI
jgi:hypothetical protein